ncbi:MAG: TauD/TfdA family dioxygenase [Acidimicrobiales bacterium]|nr:TauD/TfdA family dioxygenase [Acidimicrobiales bacterium]
MLDATLAGPWNGYLPGPRLAGRTADAWVDVAPTRFTLAPVAPLIGAVVEGVDLAEPVDAELFEQLNRALLEWKVLFFRDQDITGAQQAAFAANWGPLETHPFYGTITDTEVDAPEVVRLEKDDRVGGFENAWHSDVSWRIEPSLGSVLRAVELPDLGGDTLWADMGAAYDRLTPAMKERIDGLVAVHDWWDNFGLAMTAEERERLRPDFPATEHPVVRTHPETGRRTLYVNRIFTQRIVGLDPDESAELLDHLYHQATFPEYQCRWRWEPGGVAFWDNRATQHYAVSDYYPERRVMERITICGDRPR